MRRFARFVCQQCLMLRHDQSGGMVPMLAFGMILVVSAAAVGVDLTRVRAMQQSLGMAADAAALAAASRLPDLDAARAAALAYVEKNLPSAEYGQVLNEEDIEFGLWDPQTRTFTPNTDPNAQGAAAAVRVTAQLSAENNNAVKTFFAPIIGVDVMDVAETAIAGRMGAPCVLTLDPSKTKSGRLKNGATLEAIGCGVQINSKASNALAMNGHADMTAADICVSGTAGISGASTVSPNPRENCPGQPDPMAGTVVPAAGHCDHTGKTFENKFESISPGVYCGGLSIGKSSEIELSAGTYYIKDGPLAVVDGSTLEGTGVTIILTGNGASLEFDDSSKVDLSAPQSGSLTGLLIYQDPNYDNDHVWDGDSTTNLNGVVYLPTGSLSADSANHITPYKSCTVLITKSFEVINNSSISIDLTSTSCRKTLPAPYRRGVVLLD